MAVGNPRHTCLLLLLLVFAPQAVAQPSVTTRPAPSKQLEKQARKWVTFLELDERRAEAANALLAMGSPALPALVQALDDPRPLVVQRVAQVLRALGAAALPAKARLESMARSKDPKLALAAAHALAGIQPAGVTLVANYASNTVEELDKDHKVLRTLKAAKGPWDADRLPNGNYLITDYVQNKVIEVTKDDKVVWSFAKTKNPYKADRLANGNTLVADYGNARVVEVSPKGDVVWKYEKIRAYDVQRLVNGNTLILDTGTRIVEVTPKGKIVWTHKTDRAMDVDRLANGNTLIVLQGKGIVREVDPKGRTVSELKGLHSPNDADRLPNAHTIVAERNAITEYDAEGKKIWSRKANWPGEVN